MFDAKEFGMVFRSKYCIGVTGMQRKFFGLFS